MLGHGEPVRVKQGERVLFHILNGSATEIRSLALPGHTFHVVAMDGNPLPNPIRVPGLWLGTAERISAIVEMNHPGVWIMGDTGRRRSSSRHGYRGGIRRSEGQAAVDRARTSSTGTMPAFGKAGASDPEPDQIFDMTSPSRTPPTKASIAGRSTASPSQTIDDGAACSTCSRASATACACAMPATTSIPSICIATVLSSRSVAGQPTSGVMKDVVMVGGYQEVEVDFVADNPGLTLFHCHQQLHMDFGFMALLEYA